MKAIWEVRRNVRDIFPKITLVSRILKDKQFLGRWTREKREREWQMQRHKSKTRRAQSLSTTEVEDTDRK